MEKLKEKSCTEFSAALASGSPTPGGGGACALAGALGAALCAMVGALTVGKKKYAAVEEEVKALAAQAEDLRVRLMDLVDRDAAAFEPLSRAYAIPKEDPERGAVMEQCLRAAAEPPMEILRLACEAIDLHAQMAERGSAMVLSDVGTGVALCLAALDGGLLNVKVNTKLMADRAYAQTLDGEAKALAAAYRGKARKVYETVLGRYA